MHTEELPPPLPAAAGEATTSPQLPNHSPAAAATEVCPAASTRTCGTAPRCSQLHEGFGTSGSSAVMGLQAQLNALIQQQPRPNTFKRTSKEEPKETGD